MKKQWYTALLMASCLSGFSQQEDEQLSKREERRNRPVYLRRALGFGASNYREAATSPLKKSSRTVLQTEISRLKTDEKKETSTNFCTRVGMSFAPRVTGGGEGGSHPTGSSGLMGSASIQHSELFQILKRTESKWNFKVGGLVDGTFNLRSNSSYQNAATSYDLISSLMGSFQVARDVSRLREKEKKLWFMNVHLMPRMRQLSFRLNIALINTFYRAPYNQLPGDDGTYESSLFDGFYFSAGSGFRLGTSLNYTVEVNGRDAIQLSYLWEAYATGKTEATANRPERLEIAHHTFSFAYLLKKNRRRHKVITIYGK